MAGGVSVCRTGRNDGRTTLLVAVVVALMLAGGGMYYMIQMFGATSVTPASNGPVSVDEGSEPVAKNTMDVGDSDPGSAAEAETLATENPTSEAVTQEIGLVLGGTVTDQHGDPIADAKVRWSPASYEESKGVAHDPAFWAEDEALGSERVRAARARSLLATTDANGAYRLEFPKHMGQVSQGTVSVARSGYTSESRRMGAGENSDPVDAVLQRERSTAASRAVADASTSESTDTSSELTMDFQLAPGGSITGTVLDAESRQGAAGMEIKIAKDTGNDGGMFSFFNRGDAEPSTTVAADGSFQVSGLPAGEYRVMAFTGESDYVSLSSTASRKVFLPPSEDVVVDLTVELGGTISGRVVLMNGAAVEGIRVRVAPTDFMQSMMKGDVELASVLERDEFITSSDGKYRVRGLPLGKTYLVAANGDNYAPSMGSEVELTREQRAAEVDVTMTRGSSVSGTVSFESGGVAAETEVTVMPDMSSGLGGLSISTMAMMGDGFDGDTQTDEKGYFVVHNLPAGKFSLRAGSMSGFNPFGGGNGAEMIEVDGESDLEGVELVADDPEEEPEPGAPGMISGTVQDDLGNPLAGVSVSSFSVNGYESSQTDEEGNFQLGVQGEGPFSISVTKAGFTTIREEASPGDSGVLLTMDRMGRVSGRVLLPSGEAPQLAFKVSARPVEAAGTEGMFERIVGLSESANAANGAPDGTFTLGNVPAGRVEIVAKVAGYALTASDPIEVRAGSEVTGVEFRVSLGGSISGQVLLVTGGAIAGAKVTVALDTGDDATRAMMAYMPGFFTGGNQVSTDEEGFFAIDRLTPGVYNVSATHPDYAASDPMTVTVGEDQEVQIKPLYLSPGATLTGTISFGSEAKAGVMIQLQGGPSGMQMATTEADGTYRFEGLKLGEYVAVVMDMGAAQAGGGMPIRVRTINVEAEEVITYDLDFEGGNAVFGKITGIGAGMKVVTLRRPGGPLPEDTDPMDLDQQMEMVKWQAGMTMVTGEGEYRIDGVEPGEYVLEVPYMPANPMDLEGQREADRTPSYRKTITVEEKDVEHDIKVRKN